MSKIERKYLAHYINAAEPGASTAVYERLGKDLEEFNAEMSAQVDTRKNILGENSIVISGYEKTSSVEPYYAEEGSALFERLQNIIEGNLVLDDLKTEVVEVRLWGSASDSFNAVREEAYIEVLSYGGDTTGYQIPFKLHYTGKKSIGQFNPTTQSFG